MNRHWSWWTGFLIVVALLAGQALWAQGPVRARLGSVEGVVKVMRSGSGQWVAVSRAQDRVLYAGDHVQAAQRSRATILIDGAKIELAPGAHVIIPTTRTAKTPRGLISIFAVAGRVFVWLIGSTGLELGTEGAVAGAEGTQFLVDVAEGGLTVLTVYEGRVRFHNELGSVVVQAGEQSQASKGMAPTRPQRVDVSGIIEWEATLQNLWLPWEKRYHPQETVETLRERAKAPAPALQTGEYLDDLGELKAAEELYRKLEEQTPTDAAVSLHLGHNLLRQGLPAAAGVEFRKAAAASDPLVQAEAQAGVALALAAQGGADRLAQARGLLKAMPTAGPEAASGQLAAGLLAMRGGDVEAARTALTAAGGDYRAAAYLAALQLTQGETQSALKTAREAVQAAPSSALAQESLAAAEFFTGDLDAARVAVDAALALNPDSASARLLSADLAVMAGDLATGQREAEWSVALDPTLAPAYNTLGMIFLARNDLVAAEKAFSHAVRYNPGLVSAQTGLGVTYQRQGRLAEALKQQTAAVALDSRLAATHNNLGATYLALGRLEEARASFLKAVALQPSWGLAHANLALAYLELNRFAEAVHEGEQAVALGERSARVYTTLARVYLKQNRTQQAWAALRRARELDPDYALANIYLAEVDRRLGRPRDALREQLTGLAQQPSVMLDDREYSRTVVRVAAGDGLAVQARADGRGDRGQNSGYLAVGHERDDWDRVHSDWQQTTILGLAGRQTSGDRTHLLLGSAQWERRDRPGAELSGGPEDPDYHSRFRGAEVQYLDRRACSGGSLLIKLGYRDTVEEDTNPDSLNADVKPYQRLKLAYSGPQAEFRWNRDYGSAGRLVGGFALSDESRETSGLVGTLAGVGTPSFTPFADETDRLSGSLYLEGERWLDARTRVLVGGRLAAAEGMSPVVRPRLSVRRGLGMGGTLVFLSRPVLSDDVTELSPVEEWALADALSPLDLARGGYSQSWELQYETGARRSTLCRVGVFHRDLRNLLVDLQDPNLAPGAAPSLVSAAQTQGVAVEFERWLARDLSAGLQAAWSTTEDKATEQDLPYQPRFQGRLRLDYLDPNGWRGSLQLNHLGRRYADPAEQVRLGTVTTLDLLLAHQQSLHTDLFLSVRNVFDEGSGYWQDYPARGRKVQAGLEYRF